MWLSMAVVCHPSWSAVICRGHPWPSVAICGHPSSSVIVCGCLSFVIMVCGYPWSWSVVCCRCLLLSIVVVCHPLSSVVVHHSSSYVIKREDETRMGEWAMVAPKHMQMKVHGDTAYAMQMGERKAKSRVCVPPVTECAVSYAKGVQYPDSIRSKGAVVIKVRWQRKQEGS